MASVSYQLALPKWYYATSAVRSRSAATSENSASRSPYQVLWVAAAWWQFCRPTFLPRSETVCARVQRICAQRWIITARETRRAVLPWILGLETLLLAIFAAILAFGPVVHDARDWHGIVAGLFAAMAMGAQSVMVRLLMKDIPQTNVMTGNMTQLGIAVTELIVTPRRFVGNLHSDAADRALAQVRARLFTVLTIAIGFLGGAGVGALAFATTGPPGALAAVAIVGALTLWALVREEQN